MRILLLVLACAFCASPAFANPAAARPAPVEDVALTFARAALSGDLATARSLSLSLSEVRDLTTRKVARDEYDDLLREKLERLHDRASSGELSGATVARTGTLDPDERRRRSVTYAFIQLEVRIADGTTAPLGRPLLFIKTDRGWRFSPHQ